MRSCWGCTPTEAATRLPAISRSTKRRNMGKRCCKARKAFRSTGTNGNNMSTETTRRTPFHGRITSNWTKRRRSSTRVSATGRYASCSTWTRPPCPYQARKYTLPCWRTTEASTTGATSKRKNASYGMPSTISPHKSRRTLCPSARTGQASHDTTPPRMPSICPTKSILPLTPTM